MAFSRKRLLFATVLLLMAVPSGAQIVNRLKVDDAVFQRYAYGRMQMFNPANLTLADSIYNAGVQRDNFRYKCLGLSLEFPVRFAQGDYARMDEAVAEIKELVKGHVDARPFYFSVIHEYCQYLLHCGRASDAMLEARDMERRASKLKSALGRMYSYRIVGLIQSYRTNSWLAIQNFGKAADYCKEAKAEQELPNLLILIAQEYIKMKEFPEAEENCRRAEVYQEFFPSLRIKTCMTRAYLYNAEGDWDRFWECYDRLMSDPLYRVQTEKDERLEMDVCYLQSKGLFEEALASADSLGTARSRHALKHGIFAAVGSYENAYGELSNLMTEKDSIYIKVQNEDMAILDAEMNNARLREDAARLKAQNQMTILLGFLVMFAIAFVSMLVSQWKLRQNLDEMRHKNNAMLMARHTYQKALDAKEAENATKIRILQNRKSNTFKL
jgi:tetratricopeptide (TPR) repeat protein